MSRHLEAPIPLHRTVKFAARALLPILFLGIASQFNVQRPASAQGTDVPDFSLSCKNRLAYDRQFPDIFSDGASDDTIFYGVPIFNTPDLSRAIYGYVANFA